MKTTPRHPPRPAQARTLVTGLLLWCVLASALPAAAQTPVQPPADWTTSLRVQTPAYTLTADGPTVSGYSLDATPGAPALPVWGTAVELPPDGDYEIAFESAGAARLDEQVDVRAAAVPELPLRGGARPVAAVAAELDALPVVDRPDPTIYHTNAFYPAAPVVDGGVQWQAGRRLLALRVYPFQYNPVTKVLRYHLDLRITVSVRRSGGEREFGSVGVWEDGREGDKERGRQGEGESGDRGQPSSFIPPPSSFILHPSSFSNSLRIVTPGGGGMVRLTYAELAAKITNLATVDPATFSLSYLGQPVAAEVTGDGDAQFESGELVIFYARPYTGRYQTTNAYWLAWGGAAGLRMATRTTAQPAITALTTITQTLHVERNLEYRSEYPRPRDADHWFDLPLSPDIATGVYTATRTYALAVDDALTAGELRLTATLHGALDQAPDPDKAVRLQLNSRVIGDVYWDGRTYTTTTATMPATVLAATNQLTITAAISLCPTVEFYTVSPDWVELAYPATADVLDGGVRTDSLHIASLPAAGDGGDPNKIAVTGFSTAAVQVYDLRVPDRPVRVLATLAAPDGSGGTTINFWDEDTPGATYFLTTEAKLAAAAALEPPVQDSTPSPLASAANTADYIAIVYHNPADAAHDLWAAIDPLLAHRAAPAGGAFRVAKVDVRQIYDEFSYGRRDPEAIRSFLTYAYHWWNGGGGVANPPAPPRYVLLVGDGHYDFTGASGTTYPNLIPPYLVDVDPELGETAADNRFVNIDAPVDGVEDILPEMAIGRIPARTPADVTAAVNKILAYETAAAGDWQNRAVFVADNYADPAGDFHAFSNEVRTNWLPAATDDRQIYYNLDYFNGTDMRNAIKTAFNNDALLIQWFGHGSKFRWGSVSMFNTYDPEALNANDTWPFTLSYSCWTGYFVNLFPYYTGQTLGETLVLTPGRGSVADLSPSGLHGAGSVLVLDEAVILAVFRDRIRPVGDVADQARLYYFANSGGAYDVIDTSVLFGDPALKLRMPATLPTAPQVAIATAGDAAALRWPHLLDGSRYEVWRGTTPYFMPAAEGTLVTTMEAGFRGTVGPDIAFDDHGTVPPPPVTIIGDPATNYFWVIRSRNGDGASGNSNRVGEFDFALTPGR